MSAHDRPLPLVVASAVCAIACLVPCHALAHLVTGHVSGGGFKFEQDSLVVFRADSAVCTIRTSKDGEFARVLAPGHYRVQFEDRKGRIWSGDLVAEEQAVRQDIHLRKEKKPGGP